MFKDGKIKVQEALIEKLKVENEELKKELEIVKSELEFEKIFKDKGYEDLKELIVELNERKSTYEDLISKATLARKEYKEKAKELNELRIEFIKEFNKFMKDMKLCK